MTVECAYNRTGDLNRIARLLLDSHPGNRIFAIYGGMGSGKTTLIKAICHELGVSDVVNSPTFAIIHEYRTHTGSSVFHFDLYRLKNEAELLNLGYEEYVYDDNYCFIEWPENFENLLPQNTVKVHITVEPGTNNRSLAF